jgi:hypothetical protein
MPDPYDFAKEIADAETEYERDYRIMDEIWVGKDEDEDKEMEEVCNGCNMYNHCTQAPWRQCRENMKKSETENNEERE